MVNDGDDETKKDSEESDHGLIDALCQHCVEELRKIMEILRIDSSPAEIRTGHHTS